MENENLFAEKETAKDEKSVAVFYDATAKQRFAFEVTENGEKFDTAHVLKPLSDERYLAFVGSVNGASLDVSEAEIEAQANKAACELWDDLIEEVEDFELEENQTLQTEIKSDEKREVILKFLAVAVVEPEKKAGGKRRSVSAETQVITTEMYFGDDPTSQKHTLAATTDEWRKKYRRIMAKRYKKEPTKGLSRPAKTKYIPQDKVIGELYEEMMIEASGFTNDTIPLRVKTTVLAFVFASRFDEKK